MCVFVCAPPPPLDMLWFAPHGGGGGGGCYNYSVGLVGCRTCGMSDLWDVGLVGCRTCGVSDLFGVGLVRRPHTQIIYLISLYAVKERFFFIFFIFYLF